jgi:tRNA-dihydrouridine synthase
MQRCNDATVQRLILAPLRGVTHLSFRRCLMKHFGGLDGAVSPFLTTVAGSKIKATHLADILPEANGFLPLVPQIIGKDPAQFRTLLLAVRELGYARCDLNIGCPWPLIVKKGRGSGLLRDADNLRRMLDAGCEVMGEGLSVKVRLGIDRCGLLLERMEIFNSYPLAEMTIHARTAAQRYEGEVDLDGFADCLAAAKAPVVYNGDIRTAEDCQRLAARFPNVAGFMIGRGLITDPALARRIRHAFDPQGVQSTPPPSWRLYEAFVRDYGGQTRAELFGPGSFLGRMKEFWSYHHAAYPNGEALWRRLRTFRSYAEYAAIIDHLTTRPDDHAH